MGIWHGLVEEARIFTVRIAIIGTGYVGLVTGACLSDFGHHVTCVDRDERRVKILRRGKIPFYEPSLVELVQRNVVAKRLFFGRAIGQLKPFPEIFFVTVGTPPKKNGEADIRAVLKVGSQIADEWLRVRAPFFLIITKSTVPVGTTERIREILLQKGVPEDIFSVVSNPEFLREGSAVSDFMNPDRIVVGGTGGKPFHLLAELYRPLNAHVFFTSIRTAELTKYASNAFLATKISFINEISRICDVLCLDIEEVKMAIGLDRRIGHLFLNAGLGFGGSCLPKDVNALTRVSETAGYSPKLLKVVNSINDEQPAIFAEKIIRKMMGVRGKKIAVLGLSFKPGTDDIRESPSLRLIERLVAAKARVVAYDPVSEKAARKVVTGARFCDTVYQAVKGADAIVVATEWPEFRELDLEKVRKLARVPLLFDGRNIYDIRKVRESGFEYHGVGR